MYLQFPEKYILRKKKNQALEWPSSRHTICKLMLFDQMCCQVHRTLGNVLKKYAPKCVSFNVHLVLNDFRMRA